MILQQYHEALRDLGCVVTRHRPPTLHHAKAGSMKDLGLHSGVGQRGISDWLVIPLKAELHMWDGIEGGVKTWESRYGTQVAFIDFLSRRFTLNAWRRSRAVDRPVPGMDVTVNVMVRLAEADVFIKRWAQQWFIYKYEVVGLRAGRTPPPWSIAQPDMSLETPPHFPPAGDERREDV